MADIYCGNNQFEIGPRRLGTPYECLKKGVGYGLHSDLSDYNPNYEPIIPPIPTYCGTGDVPEGVQQGTPASCLRKGVGVGKRLQYNRNIHPQNNIHPHLPRNNPQPSRSRPTSPPARPRPTSRWRPPIPTSRPPMFLETDDEDIETDDE